MRLGGHVIRCDVRRSNVPRRIRSFAVALLILYLCISCTPQVKIDNSNVDLIMDKFEQGMILFAEPNIYNDTVNVADQMHQLEVANDWASLAKLTIETNTDDDIDWYYLGLSAEKLGYIAAAKRYYGFVDIVSIKFCDPNDGSVGGGYVDGVCYGLQLPRDSDARLTALSAEQ